MLTLLLSLWSPPSFARDPTPGAYTLTVSPVAELCLDGVGPLTAWSSLADLGLRPIEHDGQARLSLCVSQARFGGRRFSEATFAVAVEGPQGPGLYLVAAHNTVPWFARVEARRNLSPYTHGQVVFSADPARWTLLLGDADGAEALRATHGGLMAAPSPAEGFEGPIYLPSGGHFFARLGPASASAPFVPGEDTLALLPGAGQSAVAAAVSRSGFTPTGWRGSETNTHAKTRTAPPSRTMSPAP